MTKKPAATAKPAPLNAAADTTKKRSKLKLALFALVPLLLAGGGYAGWTMFTVPAGDGAAEASAAVDGGREGEGGHAVVVPPEIAAETSYTHAFALSVLIAPRCGVARVPALAQATEAEAHESGMLVNLSWLAAARRVAATTEKSCDFLRAEVIDAERLAMKMADSESKTAAVH